MLKSTGFYLVNKQPNKQHKMKTEFKKASDVTFHEICLRYLIVLNDGRHFALNGDNLAFTYWWRDAIRKLSWLDSCERWIVEKILADKDNIEQYLRVQIPVTFLAEQEDLAKLHNEALMRQLKEEGYPGT